MEWFDYEDEYSQRYLVRSKRKSYRGKYFVSQETSAAPTGNRARKDHSSSGKFKNNKVSLYDQKIELEKQRRKKFFKMRKPRRKSPAKAILSIKEWDYDWGDLSPDSGDCIVHTQSDTESSWSQIVQDAIAKHLNASKDTFSKPLYLIEDYTSLSNNEEYNDHTPCHNTDTEHRQIHYNYRAILDLQEEEGSWTHSPELEALIPGLGEQLGTCWKVGGRIKTTKHLLQLFQQHTFYRESAQLQKAQDYLLSTYFGNISWLWHSPTPSSTPLAHFQHPTTLRAQSQ